MSVAAPSRMTRSRYGDRATPACSLQRLDDIFCRQAVERSLTRLSRRRMPTRFWFVATLIAASPILQIEALVASASLQAQVKVVPARRYTVDDGLAVNRVLTLAQDRAGFMWAGTERGLQRFDGYTFRRYDSLDPLSPRALSSPIQGFVVDRRGRFIIAAPHESQPGVCCAFFVADSAARRVTRLPIVASLWYVDSSGVIWAFGDDTLRRISTLHRLDLDKISQPPALIGQDSTWRPTSALLVSRGIVWMGLRGDTAASVVRFDPKTGDTRRFVVTGVTLPHSLLEDDAGRVWLSCEDGFAVLDPGSTHFRSVELFRGMRPTNLVTDGHGGFFVATDFWLARIDRTGAVAERWQSPEVFGVGTLPGRLAVDREGGVWLATITGGLVRLDLRRPVFEHRSSRSIPRLALANDFIMGLLERPDSSLWIGTFRGGLYHVSSDWNEITAYRHDPRDPRSLASDEIWDIEEDGRGNVWVATTGGICTPTQANREFRCLRPPGERGTVVSEMTRDDGGKLWLSAPPLGVFPFDPTMEQFGAVVPKLQQLNVAATALLYDSGYLWMGYGGVFRVRVANGRVLGTLEEISSPTQHRAVYQIYRGRRGLWVASEEGLSRISGDSSHPALTQVDVPELRGTTVFSITEDGEGRLWLGTAHGLVEYSPDNGAARRYGRADGFMSGELNRRMALRRRNGDLVFGGIQGLTQFKPARVTGTERSAPVMLTHWHKVTSSGSRDERIDGAQVLRVEPSDRAFTIEFAALSYAPSLGRRYRYRMDALNSDWIETADHLATYSSPGPGHYTFRVETAAGSQGPWSPATTVAIDVIPPFWGTTWFRALVALSAFALLWAAHRLRLRQALATERVRLQISRDLHDEIGAGLSGIALLSDSIGLAPAISDRERSQLRRIGDSAREMVADLRDIVWAIDPESDRLEDVVARMKDVTADLLREVDVTFRSTPTPEFTQRITMAERRDLLLLFKELLHNIARHAGANTVRIDLAARPGQLELVVVDDGQGFDPNVARAGTGLKSIRDRAERLGGSFEIASERGHGTTARVVVRRT
jgi:signal transduction histidine kinase/ligand-binding sensor domain-containing protein